MLIRVGILSLLFFGVVCLLSTPAFADTVHHYTNVTRVDAHYIVTEGTMGGTMLGYTGTNSLGVGGSASDPYDDTWRRVTHPGGLEHADYFDRYWRQIIGSAGSLTYDLGAAYTQLYVALSQDHGPYPAEALEYRVWVSSDNVTYTQLGATTAITVYDKGWSTAGESSGAGVRNDDFSAMWTLGGAYRYVRLTPMDATGVFNEPEIDAVLGVNVIPEPATLLLMGTGVVVLVGRRRRRSRG